MYFHRFDLLSFYPVVVFAICQGSARRHYSFIMVPGGGKLEDVSRTSFGYIYHHLFLPPKLPGADDTSEKNDATLLDFVQRSLGRFLPGHHDEEAVKAGISVLRSLRTSRNPQGYLKDAVVRDILKELSSKGNAFSTCLRGKLTMFSSPCSSTTYHRTKCWCFDQQKCGHGVL